MSGPFFSPLRSIRNIIKHFVRNMMKIYWHMPLFIVVQILQCCWLKLMILPLFKARNARIFKPGWKAHFLCFIFFKTPTPRSDEKKPMANKITKTAKLRSKPLAGAMLLVDGVNCVLVNNGGNHYSIRSVWGDDGAAWRTKSGTSKFDHLAVNGHMVLQR